MGIGREIGGLDEGDVILESSIPTDLSRTGQDVRRRYDGGHRLGFPPSIDDIGWTMAALLFISHPDVIVDPGIPIQRWHLSAAGVDRMRTFSRSSIPSNVRAIWSSTETKAIEAAGILAGALGLGVQVSANLGENDRSATGFLPPAEFESVADAFFAEPTASVRGWERAVDAQTRVHGAVARIVAEHREGDLAIVAHGAVGTLLLCALLGKAIDRSFDQPFQGHYWTAVLPILNPEEGWRPIAPLV